MNKDIKYFEAIAERAQERQSNRNGKEAEAIRLIKREKIAAHVSLPPTDLNKLARHLKVHEIRHVPLAMKGRLMLEGKSITIEINHSLSEFDKRYATAHELAHLILEKKRLSICSLISANQKDQFGRSHFLTENLCDNGAEEILLPVQWLRDRLMHYTPSLEIIDEISKEANCDLSFVAERIIKKGLWHCKVLLCVKRGKKLCVIKTFPPADEAFLAFMEPFDLETSLPGNSLINKKFMEGHLRIKSGDEDYLYRAQCIPVNEKVVLSMIIYN